jgi:hypothetical protein
MAWKSPFSAKLPDTILAHIVPPFAARGLSCREDVGTSKAVCVMVCTISLKATVHPGHTLWPIYRKKKKKCYKLATVCVIEQFVAVKIILRCDSMYFGS